MPPDPLEHIDGRHDLSFNQRGYRRDNSPFLQVFHIVVILAVAVSKAFFARSALPFRVINAATTAKVETCATVKWLHPKPKWCLLTFAMIVV